MTHDTTPLPVEQADELRKKLDNIVMAIANFGHQVINEQHTKEKTFVYGTPNPLVISRVDAVPILLELFAAQATAAQERAYIRGQRDLLEKIIETPSNGTYHVSFFEDLLASLPKPEQKEQR